MTPKKLLVVNSSLVCTLVFYFLLVIPAHSATWVTSDPLNPSFELVGDVKYDYDPSINKVTITYQYKNSTGSTLNSPRFVNLFLWSNDICSTSWDVMSYNGSGVFSNSDQSATVVSPDGYVNWHSLITNPTPPLNSIGMFPDPPFPTQSTQSGVVYPYWNFCTSANGSWENNTIATITTSWNVSNPYWIQSASWIIYCNGGDCPSLPDADSDSVVDCYDNCPNRPNDSGLGTCVKTQAGFTVSYRVGNPKQYITCTSNADCTSTGGTCQLVQGDCNGNFVGDVCECYANFNYPTDLKVNASDLGVFKLEYGRVDCNTTPPPCRADVNNDGKVNASDLGMFKNEYGRIDCPALP